MPRAAVQALAVIEETLTEAVDAECSACAEIADKEARVYRRASSTLEKMGEVAAERIGAAIRATPEAAMMSPHADGTVIER